MVWPRLAMVAHLVPWHRVEEREPHADQEPRAGLADPLDERGEQSRATGKITAKPSRPAAGRQKLVDEIAVAGLQINHVKTGRLGITGRRHVTLDEPLHVVVRQQARRIGGVDGMPAVEERMVVGDLRPPARGRRLGETS